MILGQVVLPEFEAHVSTRKSTFLLLKSTKFGYSVEDTPNLKGIYNSMDTCENNKLVEDTPNLKSIYNPTVTIFERYLQRKKQLD